MAKKKAKGKEKYVRFTNLPVGVRSDPDGGDIGVLTIKNRVVGARTRAMAIWKLKEIDNDLRDVQRQLKYSIKESKNQIEKINRNRKRVVEAKKKVKGMNLI